MAGFENTARAEGFSEGRATGLETGTWLYFSQLPDQPAASFYDYSQEKWVTIGE